MDPATLATTAATALVAAMATDTWQRTRESVVALWRRVHPDQAEAVEAELDKVRDKVLAARRESDTAAEEDLAGEWRGRLLRLMGQDPGVAPELRRALREVCAPSLAAADQQRAYSITIHATASGQGRNYVAGRDQQVNG